MKLDEKRCRKLRRREVDFRTTLNNLVKTWGLCKLVRKTKKGNKISTSWIKRKARLLGLRKPLSLTIEEVTFKFKESSKKNLDLNTNAIDTCQTFV